jgi:hypothetical protein
MAVIVPTTVSQRRTVSRRQEFRRVAGHDVGDQLRVVSGEIGVGKGHNFVRFGYKRPAVEGELTFWCDG